MRSRTTPAEAPADELASLRLEVARLRALSAQYRDTEARLSRLADFPEKNPDILVGTDPQGRVTYMNQVAEARFPTLLRDGLAHPLLRGLDDIYAEMREHNQSYWADEVSLGDAAFERQVCFAQDAEPLRLRIYLHEVTRRKRAEKAIRSLARQTVFAQEEERRRLSRELHDEAGQSLTALKLSLELLRADPPRAPGELERNLKEAIALADATMDRVRLLAHGLRPPALDTLGLDPTLRATCRDFAQRSQIAVRYQGGEVAGLSDAKRICLYRVLQEALTNVAKHAWASRVNVSLRQGAGLVKLTVSDDGRGLDPANLADQGGIGLLGMRERLELLEGSLTVKSSPGKGLRLVASLPLESSP
ncbi:MAG: sensor histidine kinase [Pseudomonadota bacterium]